MGSKVVEAAVVAVVATEGELLMAVVVTVTAAPTARVVVAAKTAGVLARAPVPDGRSVRTRVHGPVSWVCESKRASPLTACRRAGSGCVRWLEDGGLSKADWLGLLPSFFRRSRLPAALAHTANCMQVCLAGQEAGLWHQPRVLVPIPTMSPSVAAAAAQRRVTTTVDLAVVATTVAPAAGAAAVDPTAGAVATAIAVAAGVGASSVAAVEAVMSAKGGRVLIAVGVTDVEPTAPKLPYGPNAVSQRLPLPGEG